MKELFKNLKQDKTTFLGFSVAGIIIATSLVIILLFYGRLPPFLPMFNQLLWGDQRLGTTFTIFIPLLVSLLIFGINLIMSALIYNKIPLLSRILAITNLLTTILTFLFVVKTIVLIL